MIPLRRTLSQLDMDVSGERDSIYVVTDGDNVLRLEQDSRSYRLNGRRGELARELEREMESIDDEDDAEEEVGFMGRILDDG